MNFKEFVEIVNNEKSEHPFWFEGECDTLADDDQIAEVEKELGAKLPDEYVEFVKKYGGGYFAFTNVFSVQPDSEWCIVDRNKGVDLAENFIAISDDEAGGYYGFLIDSGVCGPEIYYWDHESQQILKNHQFCDLLAFIIETGLNK